MRTTEVLSDSYRFWSGNLSQITSLCLPFVFASALLGHVLERSWEGNWIIGGYLPLFVDVLVYPVYGGALILYIASRTKGKSPGNVEVLTAAISIWFPLFVLTAIGTTLFLGGLLLLVLPGIWVLVRLAFSSFLLVLTNATPIEAIRQSVELTRNQFWPLFKCIVAVLAPIWILDLVLAYVARQLGNSFEMKVAIETATGFLALFLTVVLFRTLMTLSDKGNDCAD